MSQPWKSRSEINAEFLSNTCLGTLVYFESGYEGVNREAGFARLMGSSMGWPIVDWPGRDDGMCLNPHLTKLRAATLTEILAYECGGKR